MIYFRNFEYQDLFFMRSNAVRSDRKSGLRTVKTNVSEMTHIVFNMTHIVFNRGGIFTLFNFKIKN